jgi:hypothetical protein
MKYM